MYFVNLLLTIIEHYIVKVVTRFKSVDCVTIMSTEKNFHDQNTTKEANKRDATLCDNAYKRL